MKNIDSVEQLDNSDAIAERAKLIVLQQAELAIKKHGRFVLCLAGGSTPEKLYQLLSEESIDYGHWYLLYGDERCLPVSDSERNSHMIERCWLSKVDFPLAQHFIIPADAPSKLPPEQAAQQYQQQIAKVLPIDLTLLGMGEDGHTASLFPNHDIQKGDVIAVSHSPKPPSERVSLNYSVINQSQYVLFLVSGSAKQLALNMWRDGCDLPVARIQASAKTSLLLDKTVSLSSAQG